VDCGCVPVVGGTSAGFALAGSGQCGMKRTVREEDGTLPETPGVTEISREEQFLLLGNGLGSLGKNSTADELYLFYKCYLNPVKLDVQ